MKIYKKTFLILLCLTQLAKADVLLIPDSQISFADYQSNCQRTGYVCVNSYFQNWVNALPTPLFDKFVNNVDLSASLFKQSALNQLQIILTKEMISEEQLDLVLNFTQQLRDENNLTAKMSLLEKSLIMAKEILKNSKPLTEFDQENYVLFMKKPVILSELKRIKKILLQLPYYEVQFQKVPALNSNTSHSENLVSGLCEKAQVHEIVQNQKWKIQQEKSCSFNDQLQKMTSAASLKISENKHWIITGALLIGAAILASQYEVKFQ